MALLRVPYAISFQYLEESAYTKAFSDVYITTLVITEIVQRRRLVPPFCLSQLIIVLASRLSPTRKQHDIGDKSTGFYGAQVLLFFFYCAETGSIFLNKRLLWHNGITFVVNFFLFFETMVYRRREEIPFASLSFCACRVTKKKIY